jgi:hypothetical protein
VSTLEAYADRHRSVVRDSAERLDVDRECDWGGSAPSSVFDVRGGKAGCLNGVAEGVSTWYAVVD